MVSEPRELLDPPTFRLPPNFLSADKNSDYEIWSIRMPVQFDPSSLNGVSLSLNNDILENQTKQKFNGSGGNDGDGGSGGIFQQDNIISSFELSTDKDDKYSFAVGHTSETKSFRVLVPTIPAEGNEDDDSENDGDDAKKEMKILPKPFTRHLNLIRSSKVEMTEFDLAPSKERAPQLSTKVATTKGKSERNKVHNIKMREAYAPVDQVKGLKRRWNLFGSNIDVAVVQERQKRRRQCYVDKTTNNSSHGSKDNRTTIDLSGEKASGANKNNSHTEKQKQNKETEDKTDENASTPIKEKKSSKKKIKSEKKKKSEKKSRKKSSRSD